MFCSNCGSENPTTNRYCGQCGAPLGEPTTPGNSGNARTKSVSAEFNRDVEEQQRTLRKFTTPIPVSGPAESHTRPDFPTRPQEQEDAPITKADSNRKSQPENTAEQATVPGEILPPVTTEAGTPQDRISGPSFLGLSSEEATNDSLSYLYEDDPKTGHTRYWVAALILLAFAGFLVYEWRRNPDWNTAMVRQRITQLAARFRPASATVPTTAQNPSPQNSVPSGANANSGPPQTAAVQPSAPAANQASPPANADETKPEMTVDPSQGGNSVAEQQTDDNAQPASDADSAQAQTAANDEGRSNLVNQAKTGRQPPLAPEAKTAVTNPERSERATTEERATNPPTKARRQQDVASIEAKPRSKDPYADQQTGEDLLKKADAYLYGQGVPRSCGQALVYLRTAANQGSAAARAKLGGLYATGHCVPMDRVEAYNWFTLARNAGSKSPLIDRNQKMLWAEMSPTERALVSSLSH